MIETLIKFFKKPLNETKEKTPKGVCPNCWGNQEYNNMIRELYKDHQIDVNNHTTNYAFIQDFVVNKIDGIRLTKGTSGLECPTCRIKYNHK
jgi:hypothetical protein